jgi:hypothetical protein
LECNLAKLLLLGILRSLLLHGMTAPAALVWVAAETRQNSRAVGPSLLLLLAKLHFGTGYGLTLKKLLSLERERQTHKRSKET